MGGSNSGDLDLGPISFAQAGSYTFTSVEGCTAALTIIVTDQCPAGTFTPAYTVDGVTGSGEQAITVDLGSSVSLSIVQNNY